MSVVNFLQICCIN